MTAGARGGRASDSARGVPTCTRARRETCGTRTDGAGGVPSDVLRCLRVQVVEICSLTEHLLTECDRKDGFGTCCRCGEAVLKEELPRHVKAKACNRECPVSPEARPPAPRPRFPGVTEASLTSFQLPNRRSWQTGAPCATGTSPPERRCGPAPAAVARLPSPRVRDAPQQHAGAQSRRRRNVT